MLMMAEQWLGAAGAVTVVDVRVQEERTGVCDA